MSDYLWRDNLACVATYNVLEGEIFLDEFEDAAFPFAEAGSLKMGQLRYFPHTTSNPDIVELLALEQARKFLRFIGKAYLIRKQRPADTTATAIRALAKIFSNENATVLQLAEVVDKLILFTDEI
ncbi:hypothetical protein [Brevundimonas sp. SL130]|uniref:hypothetical protein n=1 Tax=Brevundimonas sp. SL130 TaxID=2995143 RepID=UPI00226C8683|nr:hypothetical protein [Brevundimonas sp. SL130]WAC60334.1 hypothetical protein OU998_02490 [Brevundimonas sp. SL130]